MKHCASGDRCELSAAHGPRGPGSWNEAAEGKGAPETARRKRENIFELSRPGDRGTREARAETWGIKHSKWFIVATDNSQQLSTQKYLN